jgi:hypothetical protein
VLLGLIVIQRVFDREKWYFSRRGLPIEIKACGGGDVDYCVEGPTRKLTTIVRVAASHLGRTC